MIEFTPSTEALAFSRRWEHELSFRNRSYRNLVGLYEVSEETDPNSKSILYRAKRADDLLAARDDLERKMEIEREYVDGSFFVFAENAIRKRLPKFMNFRLTTT